MDDDQIEIPQSFRIVCILLLVVGFYGLIQNVLDIWVLKRIWSITLHAIVSGVVLNSIGILLIYGLWRLKKWAYVFTMLILLYHFGEGLFMGFVVNSVLGFTQALTGGFIQAIINGLFMHYIGNRSYLFGIGKKPS